MKRISLLLLSILAVLFTSACTNGEDMGSASSTDSVSSHASESSVESVADSQADGPTVLSEILKCEPGDLADFTYFDTPELYKRDDGAVFPENGAIDITYSCGVYEGPYADTENAYILQLAEVLATYRLKEGPEEVSGDTPLPTGRYFTVWPSLQSDWNPVLTFFDSGEVYLDNNGWEEPHRRWYAADPTRFDELKAVLEEIHAGLDELPLDYQIEFWLYPDQFKPESKALRLGFTNKGGDTITAQGFVLEKQEAGAWQPVGEADVSDLAIIPRDTTRYAIDLANITGAQESGQYRVSTTLEADGETLPLTLEYTISADADEISNPPLPEMTPENQEYCDRYVGMWGFYSPFKAAFDEQNYIQEFHTYHLYQIMAWTEGKRDDYQQTYGVDVPAEVVEGTILRHFLLTEEQIRAQTGGKAQNSSEYYDPATNTYHFEGGYGGGSLSAVVTDIHRDGDLLTLTCDWYGMDDGYEFSQELTVRLGDGEYDFVYVAGRMLENRQEA